MDIMVSFVERDGERERDKNIKAEQDFVEKRMNRFEIVVGEAM